MTKLELLTILAATALVGSPNVNAKQPELVVVTMMVKGQPLECVHTKYSTNRNLSCNWVKFEANAKECRERSLKKREYVTRIGGTIVFPAIKNEC